MNILHLTSDWKFTGPAEPMLIGGEALRARGHRVDLVCPSPPGGEMGVFEGRDARHGFFTNMPSVMSFAIHHVTNSSVEVSEDVTTASGRWYLLQTATLRATDEAVWLAARYDDQLVFTDNTWRFKRVNLSSRFYTSYAAGWAEVPHLLQQS